MKYKFIQSLPYSEILNITADEDVEEIWIIFAYFSKNMVIDIINTLKNRRNETVVHMVFSSSSVNPLQDVVDQIIELSTFEWCDFHLFETPLMHSKLFVARYAGNIKAYIGSANLTNSANNSNIESGILFDSINDETILVYLKDLMSSCHSDDSIPKLQTKAILSHFKNELLFLALEESKIRQSISISPRKIKNILADLSDNDVEESTVTIKIRNMLNIFILDDCERRNLLKKESALKDAIKDNLAITIDGYGWVSSVWSIRKIYSNNSPVNVLYKELIDTLKECRNRYSQSEYRNDMSQKIKEDILNQTQGTTDNSPPPEIENILDDALKMFNLPHNDKKSPYSKIESLYTKLVDSADLVCLLNPYRIGGDESQQTSDIDNLDILSIDQVNLLVMCKLAIKLRSPTGKAKKPTPPSVWWFDIALDKDIYELYEHRKYIDYQNKTRSDLESIISDIQQDVSIDKCVKMFCKITGFNLGIKYPSINKLWLWKDKNEEIEDEDNEPFVFLIPEQESYTRYNFDLDGKHPCQGIMLFIDKNQIIKEWGSNENDIDLTLIEGEFILGQNMKIFYDQEEFGNYAYLYIIIN
jgi:HKD family nuclease